MEKRTSKRIPFTLEGDLVLRDTTYKVLVGNISANGLHAIASPGIKNVDVRVEITYFTRAVHESAL
jgi:hypothetical protein